MTTLRLCTSDDEEEYEDGLLPKALEVPDASDSEDDGAMPSTAEQYLRYVRREEANQEEVMTADLSKLHLKEAKPETLPGDCHPQVACPGLGLSQQWQNGVEADFSELRCRLFRWKARNRRTLDRVARRLPAATDRAAWSAICAGRSCDGGASGGDPQPTSLTTVAACSQRHVCALLGYTLSWIGERGLSWKRGGWTFALMAALEKPVSADVCSDLRQVARLCRRKRAALVEGDPLLPVASLIICLVGRYFGQADLADPW